MIPAELVSSVTARGRAAAEKAFPDDSACQSGFLVGWLENELDNAFRVIQRTTAGHEYFEELRYASSQEVAP